MSGSDNRPSRETTCDRCRKPVIASELIQCPECNDECCSDCIAGRYVACFQCEECGPS